MLKLNKPCTKECDKCDWDAGGQCAFDILSPDELNCIDCDTCLKECRYPIKED